MEKYDINIRDFISEDVNYIPPGLRNIEMSYKTNRIDREKFLINEVVEFFYYCEGFFISNNTGSDQTRVSYALENLKLYQMLDSRKKEIWYEIVIKKGLFVFYPTHALNYKLTIEHIFDKRYIFIELESYLMMFDLIKSKIESEAHGYKTKSLKKLVYDFATLIPDRYLEGFKKHVVDTMGRKGKEYLMNVTLGGK